jgi:hypothetical protein
MQLRRPRFAFSSTPWPTSRQFYADAGDPKTVRPSSATSLPEKLIKIGAKVVSHGRCVTFQMVEVAVPRRMFWEILSLIARLWVLPAPASPADGVRYGTQI